MSSFSIEKVLDAGAEQLGDRNISASATALSCALTAIDIAQTFISAGTNPTIFSIGVFVGAANTFVLYHFFDEKQSPGGSAVEREMCTNLSRSLYSLWVGALPSALMRISSLAHSYFSSPLLLGYRCGTLLPHAYQHVQYFRAGA